MLLTIFGLLGVMAAAGLVLLALGVIGRRTDDHPHCRRCAFDLFGNPAAQNCPECGADLSSGRATRLGLRERRRGMLAAGALLLLPALLAVGVVAWGRAKQVDWLTYAPEWWLLSDLGKADSQKHMPALDELLRRQAAGEISDEALQKAIAAALQRQADLQTQWDRKFGQLIERALAGGKLSDEDLERYLFQGFGLQLEVRPDIRQGDPLPMKVLFAPRFGGQNHWQAFAQSEEITLAGHSLPRSLDGAFAIVGGTQIASNPPAVTAGRVTNEFPVGVHVLRARLELICGPYNRAGPGLMAPQEASDVGQVVVRRTAELTATVRVRGRDEPANLFELDSNRQQQMEAAVSVSEILPEQSGDGRWRIRVRFLDAPVPMNFNVLVRRDDDGKEIPIAAQEHGVSTSQSESSFELIQDLALFELPPRIVEAGRLTIILRPDETGAMLRTDGSKPWGGEINIPHVPVFTQAPPVAERRWYYANGQSQPER